MHVCLSVSFRLVRGWTMQSSAGLRKAGLGSGAIQRRRRVGWPPQIFVAAADGSDEHPLLPNPDADYDAVWSPDGRSIVFTSERNGSADLFVIASI
jgi:Tol biopolymer transport system component